MPDPTKPNDQTLNSPTSQPVDQPSVPPLTSAPSDLPPIPDFQNVGPVEPTNQPTVNSGSAAPSDIPPVVSPPPKKKFGTGRIIATILGILLLVGGIGAGLVLTQQQQLFQQKAGPFLTGGLKPGETGGYKNPQRRQAEAPAPALTCNPAAKNTCQAPNVATCVNGSWTCQLASGSCPAGSSSGYTPGECSGAGGTLGGSSGGGLYCCSLPATTTSISCPSGYTKGYTSNECTSRGGNFTIPSGGSATNGCCQLPTTGGDCTTTGCPTGQSCVAGGGVAGRGGYGCVTTAGAANTQVGGKCNAGDICRSVGGGGCLPGEISTGQPCSTTNSAICCTKQGGGTTTTTGGRTTTTTTTNPTAQCSTVLAYDANYSPMTSSQLSAVTAGTTINFCVGGSASSGSFDKAKFTINGVAQAETTTHRPGSTDFCQSYQIPSGISSFNVKAQIHHATLGWSI